MTTNLIKEQLDRIKSEVRRTDRVVFALHCWMPLNNIGSGGFKLPAIPSAKIPRVSLIPIVINKEVLVDSKRSQQTNKFIPFNVEFQVDIETSWVDILNKHGQYGMVRLDSLECDIETAERVNEVFNMMQTGFVGGVLQDLPAYWGGESPVIGEFETMLSRVKTTAQRKLSELLAAGQITRQEASAFLTALPELARSAEIAHNVALNPSNGILPKSIEQVNTGDKSRLDLTDNWIMREFPDYNSTSRLNRRNEGDQITRLATLISDSLTNRPQQSSGVQVDNAAPLDNLKDLEIELKLEDDISQPEMSLADDVPEFKLPSETSPADFAAQVADPAPTSSKPDFGQCQAQNASGIQCGNRAASELGSCPVLSHQMQVKSKGV